MPILYKFLVHYHEAYDCYISSRSKIAELSTTKEELIEAVKLLENHINHNIPKEFKIIRAALFCEIPLINVKIIHNCKKEDEEYYHQFNGDNRGTHKKPRFH